MTTNGKVDDGLAIADSCIYCESAADTVEHPLPAAFGEFEHAPTLDGRLCKRCNNTHLGKLDEHFSRCGPEAFLRKYYGVAGRSKHAPINPFYRGSSGGRRIEMKAFDEQLGFDVLMECDDGEFKQMRQLVVVDQQGEAHHVPIREGTTPEQLRTAYKALGVEQPREIRVLVDDEERDWVEPLITSAGGGTMTWTREEGNATYNGATTSFVMSNRYFRAIAKIGFHYFLTQFAEYRGNESVFEAIRSFILDETSTVECANQYIGKRQLSLLAPMLTPGMRPAGWQAHLLAAEIKNGAMTAHVQMFISEDWPAPAYTVRLGASLLLDRAVGHLYAYDLNGPHGRYAGEAHALDAMKTNRTAPILPVITPG
jgi:hypothetical protein